MGLIGIQWLTTHTGLGASSHLESGGFIRSREGLRHPDIQFHFLPSAVIDHGRIVVDREAFQVISHCCLMIVFGRRKGPPSPCYILSGIRRQLIDSEKLSSLKQSLFPQHGVMEIIVNREAFQVITDCYLMIVFGRQSAFALPLLYSTRHPTVAYRC